MRSDSRANGSPRASKGRARFTVAENLNQRGCHNARKPLLRQALKCLFAEA